MPAPGSIDALVELTVREVVARAAGPIANAIAKMAAAELEAQLESNVSVRGRKGLARIKLRARPRVELTRWVADRRARRVPLFVIEMTGGLDTKKRIVAKYGENAAFEKGKPLPPTSAAAHRLRPRAAASPPTS